MKRGAAGACVGATGSIGSEGAAAIVHLAGTAEPAIAGVDPAARARAFAEPLLSGQRLDTAEDALGHADGVAALLASIGGAPSLCAAAYLVYAGDYLQRPEEMVTKAFGASYAGLVSHTRKLVQIQRAAREAQVGEEQRALQTERVHKMLLAFSRDLRVVLLRLASRLQTLRWHAATKTPCPSLLAQESQQVFAPLANRLGIWQIKWELEDLSFRFLQPEVYHRVAQQLAQTRVEREGSVEAVRRQRGEELAAVGYFFQYMVSQAYHIYYDLPYTLTSYFNGYNRESYKKILYDTIIGDEDPKHVVLLEIDPDKQNTYIDMLSTSVELGIPIVCVTEVLKEGNKLYYIDKSGVKIQIKKIYNRVIFDELDQRPDLQMQFKFTDELDVKWIGHPNWFYRISKYIMPYLKNKYVPDTYFLSELNVLPDDLDNYVLKPLFSFAGAGVIIDVTKDDLEKIQDKSNYILQKKVVYEPVLKSPNDPVKVEIRMLMLWPDKEPKPIVINNLVRLQKVR